MTDLAQVNGNREQVDTLDKARERLHCSLDCVSNSSLWLDMEILTWTPFALMSGRDAR